MSSGYKARTPLGRVVNELEETIIALLLGAMTLLTFANVVLRYGFNSSIIWSLEVVLTLFSWLVLFGIAYGFKITAHLGVDAVTNLFSPAGRKALALLSGAICIAYGVLILKGAWDYWAPFADLPKTTGIWLPTGIDWEARRTPYFETDRMPIPFDWFRAWLSETFNSYMDGDEVVVETYNYMPRLVPYSILPVAAALMLFRIVQATARVWTGAAQSLIVSHEAEDAVEDVAHLNREN
jgi:C4-dicarboxylate transporter DctQ subunit